MVRNLIIVIKRHVPNTHVFSHVNLSYIRKENKKMLISNQIEVKWHGSNKEHYTDKNYKFTKMNDIFTVNFSDLMKNLQ